MTRSMAQATSQDLSTGPSLDSGGDLGLNLDPVEIVDYRPTLVEGIREALQDRHLMSMLGGTVITRTVRKYRLGPSWLIFNTFMSVIGYSLIFGGGVFNVRTPNGMPYFLFLMVGMMGWQLFMRTLMIATRSFLWLRSVIKDVHFSLVLVPIAGSAIALLQFVLYFIAYVATIIYLWLAQGRLYAQLAPKYLLMSALGLFLCLALAWGIGLWTSALTAWARDVRMVIKYIIPFWMLVTPVLYPIERLHGKTRLIAELNPLASPVELAKVGLLGAGSVRTYAAIWSIVAIALIFLSGIWFVSRYGHALASDDDDGDDML